MSVKHLVLNCNFNSLNLNLKVVFQEIQHKLAQFIRKYYLNELLKGLFIYLFIGLFYLLITLLIEYFLWLSVAGRTVLFWLFIAVEIGLLYRFLFIPILRLFEFKKGLSTMEASILIGNYFPEVRDKLVNVFQLASQPDKGELVLASIEQKSRELRVIPFQLAVSFKRSLRYAPYAILPFFVVLFSFVLGKGNWVTESYKRVVDYKTAYEIPSPFQVKLLNNSLLVEEGTPFLLMVQTVGSMVPNEVSVVYDGQEYVMRKDGLDTFMFEFSSVKKTFLF